MTTPAQNRTRQAIVDAAIETLGQNTGASLGDIAAAAQVGRTTLHRYFAERTDLLAAVRVEADARLNRAIHLAAPGDGPGADVLLRLCREYFDLGAVLSLVFGDTSREGEPCWEPDDGTVMEEAVRRGHADGSVDPALPVDWVVSLVWSGLYSAWYYRNDKSATSPHDVLGLLLRTLKKAVAP